MEFIPLNQWPDEWRKNPATGISEPEEKPFDSVVADCRHQFLCNNLTPPTTMKLSRKAWKRMTAFCSKYITTVEAAIAEPPQFMGLKCFLNEDATHELEIT